MGLFDGGVKREMLSVGWISKAKFSVLSPQEQKIEIENYKKAKSLIETKGEQIKRIHGSSDISLLGHIFRSAVADVNYINDSVPGKTSIDEYFLMNSYERAALKNEAYAICHQKEMTDLDAIEKRTSQLRRLQEQRISDTHVQIKLENKEREIAAEEYLEKQKRKVDMFFDTIIATKIDELQPYLDRLEISNNANIALSQFVFRFREVYGGDWNKFSALLNSMELVDICAYIKFYDDDYACQKIENKYIYLSKDSSYTNGGKSFLGR